MQSWTKLLLMTGALAAAGSSCSAPGLPDAGADATGVPDAGGVTDAGVRHDAGPFDCLIVDGECAPAYEGAPCGPAFVGVPVDTARRCVDFSRRVTVGCYRPMWGMAIADACYTYDGPAGSGIAIMPGYPGPLASSPITAMPCSDALARVVSTFLYGPPCE